MQSEASWIKSLPSVCLLGIQKEPKATCKLYDLEKTSFVRSRNIMFQERRFHNFELRENTEFYNEQKEKPESSVVGAIITPNERAEEVVNDHRPLFRSCVKHVVYQ